MNKHQLLNIKKMIFELGRGGSKNHFFDRVNDAREVKRFFADAQNDDCENPGKRGRAARNFSRPLLGHNAGRSMLEMLGVLAIIGVLSVGAIMGFRQAMNRHKANVILNDVSLAFEELATHETTGAVSRYQVTAFTPESGHTLYAKRDANGNDSVEVTGVAQGVCEVLIQYDKTELYTQISDTAGTKLTACADNQTRVCGLGAGSSGSTDPDPGPGPEPTDPCEGKTCSGHGTCSDGVCTCSDGYTDPDCGTAPECNSTIACASPKVCSTDYHCECPSIGTPGVCQTTQTQNGCPAIVNVTGKCGTNGICTNGACSECSSPMIANADGTACECPAKGANCKTQNSLTCACDVCEDGFEKNAAGECVEANPCGEGQVSVTNYNSAGNNIGTTCCKVEEDRYRICTQEELNNSGMCNMGWAPPSWNAGDVYKQSGYRVVGAINGTCCGGFRYYKDTQQGYDSNYEYKILKNGGSAFCAQETTPNNDVGYKSVYISSSKYCQVPMAAPGGETICTCSSSGDPKNGDRCS